jgi:dolichol-phosphate mannosyltransferase
MRKLLVIPTFNEESKIGKVVSAVPNATIDEICVIDDGSTDNTSAVARDNGATVLAHSGNMGVGAAIRTGIDYAIKHSFDMVVVISGDDQHDANEIERVVSPITTDGFDFVQGSRYLSGGRVINPNLFRVWGIKVYTLLFRVLLNVNITDGTNGFRAFKTSIFNNHKINLWQGWLNRYELEPYLLYWAAKLGFRIIEVPVTVKYHLDGSYTKMTPLKGWWSLFRPILFLALGIKK